MDHTTTHNQPKDLQGTPAGHADSIRNFRLTWREMGQSFHAYTDARFSAITLASSLRKANEVTDVVVYSWGTARGPLGHTGYIETSI